MKMLDRRRESDVRPIDLRQVDLRPTFRLGTHCKTMNGNFTYVKVDAGVVGINLETKRKIRNIFYRWLRTTL